MKKFITLICLFLSLLVIGQVQGTIVKVKDGDTIVLLNDKNEMITIRLAGVDCPEKNQDFGTSAKTFTSDRVFGKVVLFKRISTDMYGRQIGWVYYDKDINLSEELLKAGLAWHYLKYDKNKYLAELEKTAKLNKMGIWSKPNPLMPEEFRKTKQGKP